MSRFELQSHALWYCLYHIVCVPKYRYRILVGKVAVDVRRCIMKFSQEKKCTIEELNIQADHVHMLVKVPPKYSLSEYVGMVKGRTAIRIFKQYGELKERPYWGNHFWTKGYCVDTVGLDEDKIRKYVKYQEKQERQLDQQTLF